VSIGLMNIIRFGYKGNLYPIHLNLDQVFGQKAYERIADLPETPDLVIIALPAKIVPQIFEECGQKGVTRIVLISGGFRELGSAGEALKKQLNEIAEKYNIRYIGPNCLGIHNNWMYPEDEDHIFSMNIWEKITRCTFSIVSQSGTLSSHIWFDPDNLDLGLGKSFSVGNEANVDVVDVLQYLRDDENTEVIGLYIEEIKRGREFFALAKEITPKKPIICIYVGGSEAGKRAAKSHTGSLAGNARIYEAVFKEAGIIKTEFVEEFLDLARLLTKGVIPKGNRLGILTNSGGPGAMMANNAEKNGLILPELSDNLQDDLKEMLIPTASVSNPVDATFDLDPINYYVNVPTKLLQSGEIDMLIIYGVFGLQSVMATYLQNPKIRENIEMNKAGAAQQKKDLTKLLIPPILQLSKENSIPVLYINPQNFASAWSKNIRDKGAILFQLWDRPVRCLGKLYTYVKYLNALNA